MQRSPGNGHDNLVSLPTYLSFHVIVRSSYTVAFARTLLTKKRRSKCPAKEKRDKKSKRGGEDRNRKVKDKTDVSQTSEAVILRLELLNFLTAFFARLEISSFFTFSIDQLKRFMIYAYSLYGLRNNVKCLQLIRCIIVL